MNGDEVASVAFGRFPRTGPVSKPGQNHIAGKRTFSTLEVFERYETGGESSAPSLRRRPPRETTFGISEDDTSEERHWTPAMQACTSTAAVHHRPPSGGTPTSRRSMQNGFLTNGCNNSNVYGTTYSTTNGYGNGCLIKGKTNVRFMSFEQGGADQNYPVIVSRVAPGSSADKAHPRLNEGDQVLFINGRDVTPMSHDTVVDFIRSARTSPNGGELVLTIKPN
ncbi:PDZ/DHR/GLGF domain protein, partial [Teladorsagia circumcincta]